jgi:hypothetical protein
MKVELDLTTTHKEFFDGINHNLGNYVKAYHIDNVVAGTGDLSLLDIKAVSDMVHAAPHPHYHWLMPETWHHLVAGLMVVRDGNTK